MLQIVRPALPKKRSWLITEYLRCKTPWGKFSANTKRFKVWVGHSRWTWWKFYRSGV